MYVELRAHTAFSFGDGAVSPEALALRARTLGYTHLGITDVADLGGIAKFAVDALSPAKEPSCAESKAHSDAPCGICQRPVQPIVGAELNVDGLPAAFIALDRQGYCNLAALVTLARVGAWDGWDKATQAARRGRPNVTWDQIAAHSAGLHALTGSASGPLASLIRAGDDTGAEQLLTRWREVFDNSRLSIEVQLHHAGGKEEALAATLVTLANAQGVPWITTNDPRYIDGRGRLVHDCLTALRYDLDLREAARRGLLLPNHHWALLSPREMARRWERASEGIAESRRIADSCEPFTLDWMRPPLPDFRRARGEASDDAYLRARTYEGAHVRWGPALSPEQTTQLDHELALIQRLGFAGFFLVMYDAIRFARGRGILCQGRGSAANSAVAFCLGITPVDPVKHGLLFERFLSDARVGGGAVEPPDIDVDFEHERREEVLDYMYAHYDRTHAAITGVTQMYRAPNAVLDAMRALGYPAALAVTISKRVHQFDPADGAKAVAETVGARAGLDLSDRRGQSLLGAIAAFEGLARLRSTHVGGFVLSSAPLGDYLPIEQTTMGRTIIQFDKDDLDVICVPKFDFLGLGALAAVRRAFDVIEIREGTRPELYSLPTDDQATYDLIGRGETIGTFQIESRAQINSVLRTKPSRLYDIVVQVALIRPGPIQARFVHPYTERRLGRAPVEYTHPALEPILARTQGIPIFQEQAMAIAMTLGGYTGSQADALRRTMGNIRKKGRLVSQLHGLRAAMIARGERGELAGMTEAIADRICEDLHGFANYGFPESHAWSFALIAYATAWLKTHYPAEYLLGLLNAQPMGFYPVSTLIHEARRSGVEVRPPCLAVGDWECIAEDRPDSGRPAVRVGWESVRGIPAAVIDRLRAARALGPFVSIADVVTRAALQRADVVRFASAGAFAAWSADRRYAAWEGLRVAADVLPLAPASRTVHDPPPVDRDRLVLLDYYTVGMSVEGHPMEAYREEMVRRNVVDSSALERTPHGNTITVAGLVTIRQRPSTAKGTIFLLLEDEFGFINIIVNPRRVAENEEVVMRAPFMVVSGTLEKDGDVINVIGRTFAQLKAKELVHASRNFR